MQYSFVVTVCVQLNDGQSKKLTSCHLATSKEEARAKACNAVLNSNPACVITYAKARKRDS